MQSSVVKSNISDQCFLDNQLKLVADCPSTLGKAELSVEIDFAAGAGIWFTKQLLKC